MTDRLRMTLCDRMGPPHASPAAFMDDLVAHVNAFWREVGGGGCTVAFADYGKDGVAVIETQPGDAPITIDDVRAAITDRRNAA